MKDLRYVLIRYIRDKERMEPLNAGVILQGEGRVDLLLSQHLAKRKDVSTAVWQKWRQFFTEEVRGDVVPLFQPAKTSAQFLTYLAGLCSGTVVLSQPLRAAVDDERPFEQVLDSLYQRLVAPPEEGDAGPPNRPTSKFREIASRRNFLGRGLVKGGYVSVNDQPLWSPYRQFENGEVLAIDKVEVARNPNLTANEIEKLPTVAGKLRHFLSARGARRTRFYLLLDDLSEPFTDQAEKHFRAMRGELESNAAHIAECGGTVLRVLRDVQELADELDAKLKPLPEPLEQT